MKICIIGNTAAPYTDIPEEERAKFDKAERQLIAKGYEVYNPFSEKCQQLCEEASLKDSIREGKVEEIFMISLTLMVFTCDAVFLIDDYYPGTSTITLLDLAHSLGRPVYRSNKYFNSRGSVRTKAILSIQRSYVFHRLPAGNVKTLTSL